MIFLAWERPRNPVRRPTISPRPDQGSGQAARRKGAKMPANVCLYKPAAFSNFLVGWGLETHPDLEQVKNIA